MRTASGRREGRERDRAGVRERHGDGSGQGASQRCGTDVHQRGRGDHHRVRCAGTQDCRSGVIEAKASDTSSIIDYGRRTLRLNLPSIDDLDAAQAIADFERDRRAQPRGTVQALTVASPGKQGGGHHAQQLALTLGDLITVTETQTARDANYYVTAKRMS